MLFKILISLALIYHVVYCADNSNLSNESNSDEKKLTATSASSESNEIDFGSRIIGGKTAKPGELPYVARLVMMLGHYQGVCSGTVLSSKHLLTAAHCLYSDGAKVTVAFVQIFNTKAEDVVRISSSEIYVHPAYNEEFNDDIALIKLGDDKSFKGFGTPPSLPTGEVFTNTAAIVSGWGKTSDRSGVSSTLQYAIVNTISNDRCRRFFGPIVKPTVICTLNKRKGICGGDSGGPLMVAGGNTFYVVGVNAFGSSKCESRAPSGYTYVLPYVTWIKSVM